MHYFFIPIKVVLIKLSDSSIQDKIDRPRQVIIRSESCPDLSSSDVCSGDLEPNQVTTCDVQAERKVNKQNYFMLGLYIWTCVLALCTIY